MNADNSARQVNNLCDFDADDIVKTAASTLEQALKEGGGNDRNLFTALEILRDYEPSVAHPSFDIESTNLDRQISIAWNEIFDEFITTHAQPRKLKDGILVVNVDHAAWLSEIARNHKKRILAELQQRFGKRTIHRISYAHFDLPSTDIHFRFPLPESLIRVSAAPQIPCSFAPDHPLSAQDLIRAALICATGTKRLLVSFHPECFSPSRAILKVPPHESAQQILSPGCVDFEVFAEDDFLCQRCGRRAPDVLLCLGEVRRVQIFDRSYVTICLQCDRAIRPPGSSIQDEISHDAQLQSREQQRELLAKFQWFSERWSTFAPDYVLSAKQRRDLCGLILQFDAEEIVTAMSRAAEGYIESVDGTLTEASIARALREVGRICHGRRLHKDPRY